MITSGALPTDDQIRALHQRFAPSAAAFDLVHTHCLIVWEVARQLLPSGLDADLVRAGALLHDVGVYRLAPQESYIRHGVLGEELLREAGLPDRLSRFCAHHTGVGLTRQDVQRQGLPLPPGDYLAGSAEERLVMYADKFHSKRTPPVFVSRESYRAGVARFGADKAVLFDELVAEFGEPDLAALSAAFGHPIL